MDEYTWECGSDLCSLSLLQSESSHVQPPGEPQREDRGHGGGGGGGGLRAQPPPHAAGSQRPVRCHQGRDLDHSPHTHSGHSVRNHPHVLERTKTLTDIKATLRQR